MKRLVYIGLAGWAWGQFINLAWAGGPGTAGPEVLKIGVGARAIAMGEAYTAQADDVSSLYWNPAGLALMQERQASFTYSQFLKDLTYQNAAIGIPLENGAIGGNLSYLSYGNIDGFDASGNPTGSQNAHSAVGTVGAAWLGNQWSLGFNVKGVQQALADVTANGAAFDVGGNIIYPKPVVGGTLRFGVAVRNLGSGLSYLQQTDPYPREWRFGLAAVQMLNRKLNMSLDYAKPVDDNASVQGGAEYWFGPHLAIRAGYVANHNAGSGIRTGAGLRIKGLSFDYAYAGFGELGITHRYEISFRFGEPRPILSAEERKILQEAQAAMRHDRYDRAVLLLNSLIELEPHYRKAQRLMQVAMVNLEHQQKEKLAQQGTVYDTSTTQSAQKPNLPDLEDLEQLLSIGQSKAAQITRPASRGILKPQEQQP